MYNSKKNLIFLCFLAFGLQAQDTLKVNSNLVTEGIPPIPSAIVSVSKKYTEYRSAGMVAWHPTQKEMLISTRFGNTNQLHEVKFPRGARSQLTFFDEPVRDAAYDPEGNYFLFSKDTGGNEFGQLYRFDIENKKVTLLTDGKKSQNGGVKWSRGGKQIAFTSTMRNGKDRDVYIMMPTDKTSLRMVSENQGGGWSAADWSVNDAQLILGEQISVNESRIYTLDLATNKKTLLLPIGNEKASYKAIGYSQSGKELFILTNRNDEYNRIAVYHLDTKKLDAAFPTQWEVDEAELSYDRKYIAYTTNEKGLSNVCYCTTDFKTNIDLSKIFGTASGLTWHPNSKSIGFTVKAFDTPGDVFEYDLAAKKLIRWTVSETGFSSVDQIREPKLITWKSFDGKMISGFYYQAPAKFTGKRPVIINIHGGPEGQSRPVFLGQLNYYLYELGISIIFPNVRGSAGFGKTFLDLDNGLKREESVKDIGSLIDWVNTQPDLDSQRIMITGGSYGGYMTLAVSCMYSDKIRCSLDVVGISHFKTFLVNTESYRRDLRRVEYGDERDPVMAAFFEKIAPMNNTSKIKKPLFIVQGFNDPRVPYTESVQMKNKIKEQGGVVWFLMANDEGHGFAKKNNTDFQFYATVEFINKYLLN